VEEDGEISCTRAEIVDRVGKFVAGREKKEKNHVKSLQEQ